MGCRAPLQTGINIPLVEHFPAVQTRWNTNQEVAQILCSVANHPEWLTTQVRERPASGSQLLFKRFDGYYFKRDGYEWKRRREGSLIREDHMKLKVQRQDIISANYVHSAVVPTFHRRVYYLTSNPDIVLVHYLNSADDTSDGRTLAEKIAQCIRASNLQLTQQQLISQISPILSPTTPGSTLSVICAEVWDQLVNVTQPSPSGSGPRRSVPCQPPASQSGHPGVSLERRNSCSSAYRRGLSSMALRRQPSTFSDSVDASFVGVVVNNCGKEGGGSVSNTAGDSICGVHSVDSRSHSAVTQRSVSDDAEAMSLWRSGGGSDMNAVPIPPSISNPPSSCDDSARHLSAITVVCPTSAPLKGGVSVLVIGAWYMKSHEYTVLIGERRVPAKLIQVGVLSTTVPPGDTPGPTSLRVLCDDQIISAPWEFVYSDEIREERISLIQQSLIDRMQLFMAAFGVSLVNTQTPSTASVLDEPLFLCLARSLLSHQLTFPHLLLPHPSLPTRTLLHLSAALDYHRLTEYLLWWRRQLPYNRELDPLSRDSEGRTALHIAVCAGHMETAKVLVKACRASLDVLDDRGRTPCDLTSDPSLSILTTRTSPQGKEKTSSLPTSAEDVEHVTSTALWVFTNGETVTNELKQSGNNEGRSTRSSSFGSEVNMEGDDAETQQPGTSKRRTWVREPLHVEISMDTDVHVPDSPKMADLFEAITSPGLINDGARAKMAILAQQIIDALPQRIKNDGDGTLMELHLREEQSQQQHVMSFGSANPLLSTAFQAMPSHDWDEMFHSGYTQHHLHQQPSATAQGTGFSSKQVSEDALSSLSIGQSASHYRPPSHLYPNHNQLQAQAQTSHQRDSSFSSSRGTTFESTSFDFDKDLGEFFSINVDGEVDPIQQRLGDLKLSDREQRDVYEASKVIQRAYREYRARATCRRQADMERKAAVTIQSCYRRYKQFCYIKKLHNAAILVQKHFRMRKRGEQRGGECQPHAGDELPEHPTLDGQSIRIQVPPNSSSLLREHRAAATIQHAYRGHRKRQAAARKIQKFMKQSRIKLRKMHESSGVACSNMETQEAEHREDAQQRAAIQAAGVQMQADGVSSLHHNNEHLMQAAAATQQPPQALPHVSSLRSTESLPMQHPQQLAQQQQQIAMAQQQQRHSMEISYNINTSSSSNNNNNGSLQSPMENRLISVMAEHQRSVPHQTQAATSPQRTVLPPIHTIQQNTSINGSS